MAIIPVPSTYRDYYRPWDHAEWLLYRSGLLIESGRIVRDLS